MKTITKIITPVLFIIFLLSCEKASELKTDAKAKEYVFNYNKEKIDELESVESFLNQENFKFDNYLEIISREKFQMDSLKYQNDITIQSSNFSSNTLKTSYGLIKFMPNDTENSDSAVKYSYAGYSQTIKSYFINLQLYEGERILLVNAEKYYLKTISSLPYFSPSRKYAVNSRDNEGMSSQISFFKVGNMNMEYVMTLWSDKYVADHVVWDDKDNIILKLRQIDNGLYSYAKILIAVFNSPNKIIKKSDGKIVGKDWKGIFKINTKAISNYNQEEIDLLYTISVTSDNSCVLSVGADQAQDYWCEGDYYLTSQNNILHATGKCDEDNTNDFFLKYENGKYFIKSKRFLDQDWQNLLKEN